MGVKGREGGEGDVLMVRVEWISVKLFELAIFCSVK